MLGQWNVNVTVGKLPQKVATAFGDLNIVGAEYEPIAYLGSQQVNGVNHAVLAEQTLTVGKDTKNIVVMIFNEKQDGTTLTGIERVVESGGEAGGISVCVNTDIPEDAEKAFKEAFNGYVGVKVEPFALLGTQITKGTNYILAAKTTPVTEVPVETVELVTVNGLTKDVSFVDILTSKQEVMQLGYAFTWLRRQNTSVAKPLGEWP